MTSSRIFAELKDYLIMTIGCFVFTFAWEAFMIPNDMSAGGLMGLCTVLQYATGGLITASYSYAAINVILILVAVVAMGIGFGFKTIYCIAVNALLLEFLSKMTFLHAVEGNFFYVPDPLVVPLIAGVLESFAVGTILRAGGSTGGTDIVALMVNKYWPVSLSKVFLLTDFIIICSMLLLPDKAFADCIYGFEMMVAFSLTLDLFLGGQTSSFQLMVFSDKYNEIADYIIRELDRGVTVLQAQGWFTKKDKKVLLILINQKQFPSLSKAIKKIDPRAFLSVSKAHSVYGEGFEEIKTGAPKLIKKHKK